jgi:hypothetical protein
MLGFAALGRLALGRFADRPANTLTAATGSYALVGPTTTLRSARRLTAAVGGFTLTGIAAAIRVGLRVRAAAGAYVLTWRSLTGARQVADGGKFLIRRARFVLQKLRDNDPRLDQ